MEAADVIQARLGQYSILDLALPGKSPISIGILLLDPETQALTVRLRRDLETVAPEEEMDLLEQLEGDLERQSGTALLDHLEDTLSNFLRISDRETVAIETSPHETAERLYKRHVKI